MGVRPRRLLLFRVFAAALVLGALVHVVTLLPRVGVLAEALTAGTWLFFTTYTLSTMTALGACALAALLLWKASHKADGRALTLFLGFLALFWGSLFRFLTVEAGDDQLTINLSFGSGWVSQTAVAAYLLAVAAFVRFSAFFPAPLTADRLPPPRRARWARRVREAGLHGWTIWGAAVAALLLPRLVAPALARILGLGADAEPPAAAVALMTRVILVAAAALYVLLPLTAIGMGVHNLRTSYRLASAEERRRMMWVTTGFSLATWLIVAALGGAILLGTLDLPEVTAIGLVVLIVFAPLLIVLGSAMGVLYAGAIDPTLALRRGTVYGALGALGVVMFAGLENVLSSLVEPRLGLPTFVGPLVAGAIGAALLIPIQRRVSRAVAQRLGTAEGDRRSSPDTATVASRIS